MNSFTFKRPARLRRYSQIIWFTVAAGLFLLWPLAVFCSL